MRSDDPDSRLPVRLFDPETGFIEIAAYTTVDDVGRAGDAF